MKINFKDFEKLGDIFQLMNLVYKSTLLTTDSVVAYEDNDQFFDYNIIQMSEVVELDIDFDVHGLFLVYKDMNGNTNAIMHFGEFTLMSKKGVLND